MKVKELIERLEKINGNLPVIFEPNEGEVPIDDVYVYKRNGKDAYCILQTEDIG